MATTTCPSCGRPVTLPKGYQGGPLACTNTGCGLSFEPRGAARAGAAGATAGASARASARPAGSRHELLDRIPPSFATSPPMVAIGAVVALLYGMVLMGAVTSWKKHRLEELAKNPPREPIAVATANHAAPPVPTTEPSGSAVRPAPKEEPKKSVTPAPPSENPAPKPESKAAEQPTTTRTAEPATKPAAPVPPVPPTPPAPPQPKVEQWGALKVAGMSPDCSLLLDGTSLEISIPGSLHFLNPQAPAGNREPPRLLTSVDGDFVAKVRVAGRVRPGTNPLPNLPFPFQGAGLVLWQDAGNFLRLERSSIYSPEGKRLHQILLELYRDGRPAASVMRDVSDTDLLLRFDRRGNEVRCGYSPDNGRTWLEVKRQPVNFPSRVDVGVSASNVSPQVFRPRFEAWELTGAGGRTP
ncbi:MAG: hypothetical protein U0794_08220 [Isosphaeraceae bacterium]